jgi:hypothetical protein
VKERGIRGIFFIFFIFFEKRGRGLQGGGRGNRRQEEAKMWGSTAQYSADQQCRGTQDMTVLRGGVATVQSTGTWLACGN